MRWSLPAALALAFLTGGCGVEPPTRADDASNGDAPDVPAWEAGDDVAGDALSSDDVTPEVGGGDAATPDARGDVDAAATDVVADAADEESPFDAAEAAPDAGPDATPDARLDAALDARIDATLDAARDAALDARLDAAPDAARDAATDARLDAAPDARLDAALDAAPDAPTGPRVDRTTPQLHSFSFSANEADPAARVALGNETAFLDTRVAPRGRLVVYLHGAGAPTTCGSNEHGRLLASWGFHVLGPCYVSDYGVGNCGADIGGCRLEAFEGVDHHPFVSIAPPDAIETRVVRALQLLQRRHPGGDWQYYLDGARPRWGAIVISGISHGASSAGLIGQVRAVERAVMLSGPLDTGQAWLARAGLTPRTSYWGFTHRADTQHAGHLAAFATLGLPGAPAFIDGAASPYGGSHRLATAATTTDGHSSTQAGGASPRDATGRYTFEPAWRLMYGVTP